MPEVQYFGECETLGIMREFRQEIHRRLNLSILFHKTILIFTSTIQATFAEARTLDSKKLISTRTKFRSIKR